ncbi:nitrate reductase cytochrome c-type subunit [Kaarinaea lacus]
MNTLCKRFLLVSVFALLMVLSTSYAQDVKSLRGAAALDSESVTSDVTQIQKDLPPIERVYVQQPPLIPHGIEGYKIDLRSNKCLTCHDWKNAKKTGATKISLTHFKDRDGLEMTTVAPRRYFCTQCHVPQKNVQPLVENQFKSGEGFK